MERTALLQADYLDILFDHRNKNYGGYELRKHYPQRVKKAMGAVLMVTCLISGYSVYANRERSHEVVLPPTHTIDLAQVPDIPQPPKQETPALPPPPSNAATASFTPPEIIRDNEIKPEDQMADVADLRDKQIGIENHDGDPTNSDISVSPDTHPGIGGNGPVESDPPSKPVTFVAQMPEFNGDINKYLASNTHYPEAAKDAGIEGRVVVQFVVNEDGSIVEAHVLKGVGGGCNEEALRVVNGMPRWKPGKNNGKAVRVLFTLPMTFTLE